VRCRGQRCALHTRSRSIWRREVRRGDDQAVRLIRLAIGSRRPMIPYLFTRIPGSSVDRGVGCVKRASEG